MPLTCKEIEDGCLFYRPGWQISDVIAHVYGCEPCAEKMREATKQLHEINKQLERPKPGAALN